MVALYTEGFCIVDIRFSLDIYAKLINSLPNQATQLTASPEPLGTEKDRKSKSAVFLSSVPKYKYSVLLFSFKLELRSSVEWIFSISQIHWTSFRLIRILLYYFEKIFQPLRAISKRNQLSHRYFPVLAYL